MAISDGSHAAGLLVTQPLTRGDGGDQPLASDVHRLLAQTSQLVVCVHLKDIQHGRHCRLGLHLGVKGQGVSVGTFPRVPIREAPGLEVAACSSLQAQLQQLSIYLTLLMILVAIPWLVSSKIELGMCTSTPRAL